MSHYVAALSINHLRLAVRLGVEAGERALPQAVELDATFYFEALPACALDDDAESFICYDIISAALADYVAGKEFRFIEYLCLDLHRVIRMHLDEQMGEAAASGVKLWLRLHKCAPPVPMMLGGAEFIYSDVPLAVRSTEKTLP